MGAAEKPYIVLAPDGAQLFLAKRLDPLPEAAPKGQVYSLSLLFSHIHRDVWLHNQATGLTFQVANLCLSAAGILCFFALALCIDDQKQPWTCVVACLGNHVVYLARRMSTWAAEIHLSTVPPRRRRPRRWRRLPRPCPRRRDAPAQMAQSSRPETRQERRQMRMRSPAAAGPVGLAAFPNTCRWPPLLARLQPPETSP